MKRFKKRLRSNKGNSFIMVVATLSFLAVLVAAILVAVALCYRLKAYDINARDNFYYLEQAMDEIYAGVGADAMTHLNEAYDDTIEVLVYFDPKSQSYVSMDDNKANKIMMNTYMKLMEDDTKYQQTGIYDTLNGFISNKYDATTNKEGISLSVGSVEIKKLKYKDKQVDSNGVVSEVDASDDSAIVVHSLVLRREARYSTAAARKIDIEENANGGDTFVQTITTDLQIGRPDFDIDFNTISAELSNLYSFSMIADKGIEITGIGTSVNITGNLYAASDFYNKQYDNATDTLVTNYNSVKSAKDSSKTKYQMCNGLEKSSMYSGFLVDQADVLVSSDLLVVPGTIAALDGATLSIAGANQDVASTAEVWADSIVMGGYSFLRKVSSDTNDVIGASINMRANSYISDDLELNAKGSSYNHIGQYYGYNYSSQDNRIYTKQSVAAGSGRVFATNADLNMKNGASIPGQAHYNSSSIIINGENSSLNLASVTDLYIAGQAYIETSKNTSSKTGSVVTKEFQLKNEDGSFVRAKTATVGGKEVFVDADGNEVDPNADGADEKLQVTTDGTGTPVQKNYTSSGEEDEYSYSGLDSNNYTTTPDASDPTKHGAKTPIQDYATGEAISIKSNQLAYIPNEMVTEDADGNIYFLLPVEMRNSKLFTDYFDVGEKDADGNIIDISNAADKFFQIPVVKTVISGKAYYFFDFSTDMTRNKKTSDVMNQFLEDYSNMFHVDSADAVSEGQEYGLTNITDYEYFKVKLLKVNTTYDSKSGAPYLDSNGNYTNIYSNSAISVLNGTSFTIKAKSDSVNPLIQAAANINANRETQLRYMTEAEQDNMKTASQGDTDDAKALQSFASPASLVADDATSSLVTLRLQQQYKEVKYLLTPKSSDAAGIVSARDTQESLITPINYYFNYNLINDGNKWVTNDNIISERLSSGYHVWLSNGDVNVSAVDASGKKVSEVKGLIICMGDVTFDSSVKSFEGLIVTGSKIIVNNSLNITSNEEIVKTILRECDEAQGIAGKENLFNVCKMFKHYKTIYKEDDESIATSKVKDVSAVQFEDILKFDNWQKNVD